MQNRDLLKDKKRIVVKIGSSSLTYPATGQINYMKMEKLVRQIADLKNSNKEVIIVSSGAIAVGKSILKIDRTMKSLANKQAAAAVGQASLMMKYQKLFREYEHEVAQILITKNIIDNGNTKKNAINTFKALLDFGTIPIVNENDTIATEEIEFGDNDTLSAVVSVLAEADLLIILSDIDGLYDENPSINSKAKLIHQVNQVDDHITNMAGDAVSEVGTGGMITKVNAAKLANKNGIDLIIANANEPHIINRILEGEMLGTLFIA